VVDEIVSANLHAYDGGGEVAQYLTTPYHRRRIETAVDLLVRETRRRPGPALIADLGAGSATVARQLRGRGARVVLVDGTRPAALTFADVVLADLTRPLPLRSGTLDGVFAGEIIEHLFEPIAFLRECHRVLVPGGAIVVTTPNLATLRDRVRFLLGRSPRQVDPHHPYLRLHIRPFTASSLVRAFTAVGFTPVGLRSNYVILGSDRREFSSRLLARAAPSIGGSLILAGVKAPHDATPG
jgi:SAM-dependent methyltransferase